MRSRAAILYEYGRPWSVEEFELDPPSAGEVLVRLAATGLCHSDEHIRQGKLAPPPDTLRALGLPAMSPTIGGHEGSGVVVDVGEGVTRFAPGDHVVTSFVAVCGQCRWCASGMEYLCDTGSGYLGAGHADGWHLSSSHRRRTKPRARLQDRGIRRTHCRRGEFARQDRSWVSRWCPPRCWHARFRPDMARRPAARACGAVTRRW